MSKKMIPWAAAACALMLIAGACSNGGSGNGTAGSATSLAPDASGGSAHFDEASLNKAVHEGTPKAGGTITYGLESDIQNVSPNQNVIQPADVQMANAVFDPLISYGDHGKFNGIPVTDNTDHTYNQLADSITSSPDLKTWTLKLRTGVKFSNGKPLDAQQVVDHTMWVKNGGQCSCKADADNIASVTAINPTTVRYTLTNPVVTFPAKLTGGGLGWITEKSARDAAPDPNSPDIAHLIGTGPFVYASKSGDSYTVSKNPTYYGVDRNNHDAKLPYLNKIVFRPLDDSITRLQAVQSNGVQIMQTADTSNLTQATADKSLDVQPSEGSSSTILILNLTHHPFGVTPQAGEQAQATADRALADTTPEAKNALKFRQAFNYSVNRNEINQKYYKGWRQPAYGFLPESNRWYTPVGNLPRFDLAKAQSLVGQVRAAGVDPAFKALCINTPEATGIFQILKQQATAAGMNAQMTQVEQAVLVTELLQGDGKSWDVACFRSPQIVDPDGFYGAIVTGGNTNIAKYSNANVDKWMNEARATSNFAQRKALYDKSQAQVTSSVVYVPLLFDLFGNVFRQDVSGLSTPSPSSLGIIRPGELYYRQ